MIQMKKMFAKRIFCIGRQFAKPGLAIFYMLFLSSALIAQNASDCTEKKAIEDFIRCTIEDHSKDANMFPRPPFLTDSVIAGVKRECELHDSTRYYLNTFSYYHQRFSRHREQPEQSLKYFLNKDCYYTLLALTVHWNPDKRVYASKELYQLIRISMLRNDQKLKTGQRPKEYRASKEFLIYVLENTPWTITGEENATIHRIYIEAILTNLYLLFGEKLPYNDSQVYVFTDKVIQTNINRWKEELKK